MATLTSISISTPAIDREAHSSAFAGFKDYWQQFFTKVFNPYRPELHYMRGPGPAWRAKYGDPSAFRLKADPD